MVDNVIEKFVDDNPEYRQYYDLIICPPSVNEAVEEFPEVASDSDLVERWNEYVKRPVTRMALYLISRRKGSSHTFAAACACQSFPSAMTEDVFWGGRKHFAEVYGDAYHSEVKSLLAQQGHSLSAHDEYMPELAQYKGDPRAVVSRSQGRSYIKKLCESQGLACEGGVTVKGRAPTSDPLAPENCVDMAPDLVAENFERFSEDNPDEARKIPKKEIKAAMVEKHGAK